jgi:signal transduction histidine kinase
MEEELTTLFHKRLSERANLAIDLNDSLLQTIEASKLIADDALESSSDPDRTRSAMARLSYWLGNAAVEGQAALNSLRKATYDGNDLASGFQRAAEECLTHRSLDFVVTTTGNSKDMQPMVRDEIYLLGYEIISNFYRRTDANRLEISLIYGADFSMRVKSSGQMPRAIGGGAEMSSPFDLHRMQRRVQRFGATLSLGTPSSSSVELTLTVPGNIIFTRSAPLLPQWLLLLWQRLRSRKSSTE